MSYQFEDDSALEELLNQQLDRRAKPTSASVLQARARVPTAGPQLSAASDRAALSSYSRPLSRQLSTGIATDKEEDGPNKISAKTSGKLSAWLNPSESSTTGNQAAKTIEESPVSVSPKALQPNVPTASNREDSIPTFSLERPRTSQRLDVSKSSAQSDDFVINESLFDAERLQEMSKQRLILHITDQIRPHLMQMSKTVEKTANRLTQDLNEELEKERAQVANIERSCAERLRLEEGKWSLLQKQLESRLESCEQELVSSNQRNQTHLSRLNEEFEASIKRLREGYETRLADERRQFDETIKRREELHRLELDSKLRINLDVNSLETMHKEWQSMVKTTISELDNQFKAVEDALGKQTSLVNGTNKDLADKTSTLSAHYDGFKRQADRMNGLVEHLTTLLPELDRFRSESDSLIKQSINQLSKLTQKDEQLYEREQQLNKQSDSLARVRESLNEERLQLAIESNRICLRQERLEELISSNEMLESKLITQNNDLNEKQTQLQAARASLDSEASQLREQNYDLHLLRKRLHNERDKLDAAQTSIEKERDNLRKQVVEVDENRRKVVDLRVRLRKELEQLTRLQRSLVCSLCLSRLFPNELTELKVVEDNLPGRPRRSGKLDQNGGERKQTIGSDSNEWITDAQTNYFSRSNGNNPEHEGTFGTLLDGSTGGPRHVQVVGANNYNLELSRMSLKRFERESRELAREDKYVELLSSG